VNNLSKEISEINGIKLMRNCILSEYTSMQVGGMASFIAEVEDKDSLIRLLAYLKSNQIPWYPLGGGSNTIFTDKGFFGVILKLTGSFRNILKKDDYCIQAGAAAQLSSLLDKSINWGMSGLEFCVGIPGTVGGATIGNSGIGSLGIHDRILSIHGISSEGEELTLRPDDYSYGYRKFEGPDIFITSIELRLDSAEADEQNVLLESFRDKRKGQPLKKASSGSIFKNPAGDYAGRLIDSAGLKGRTIGGACISNYHGNWIVNNGNATADDVLELIVEAQRMIRNMFDVHLEPEVQIIEA
jgi:UDP-N-acetylmuramate dehydrogenase